MKSKMSIGGVDGRIRAVLKFERFFAQRLREAAKDAAADRDLNGAQREIFHAVRDGSAPPSWLSWRLGLDRSYLSRMLKRMEADRFVTIEPSDTDRRERRIALTDLGRRIARNLEQCDEDRVRLPQRQQKRLIRAMLTIQEIFQRDAVTNLLECCEERLAGAKCRSAGSRVPRGPRPLAAGNARRPRARHVRIGR
jgi:DNA-binding MarR family transcriptional regulator